jgi:2-polyprenyl-3-methyl-5-hydroxy-6-metoxy-1,4-benzoquinol methylase
MRFTGERMIPNRVNWDSQIEHTHRYRAIQDITEGKIVLDAACGSGYGSNILAERAYQVHGIDISIEAIDYAEKNFGGSNIHYSQGDITDLKYSDNTFDVVVSFETIEHISESMQKLFLNQIERVLKPDGILIMSTPNKKIFTDDKLGELGEFHIKEFYQDEFVAFITEVFPNHQLYYQYFSKTSNLIALDSQQIKALNFTESDQLGKFFIIVASKSEFKKEEPLNCIYYYPDKLSRCNDYTQVYFGKGGHFSEQDSVTLEICNIDKKHDLTVYLDGVEAENIRIDPLTTNGKIKVNEIVVNLVDGNSFALSEFTTNAEKTEDNIYNFLTNDPQINIHLGGNMFIDSIDISFDIMDINTNVYDLMIKEREQIQASILNQSLQINELSHINKDLITKINQLEEKNFALSQIIEDLNILNRNQELEIEEFHDTLYWKLRNKLKSIIKN